MPRRLCREEEVRFLGGVLEEEEREGGRKRSSPLLPRTNTLQNQWCFANTDRLWTETHDKTQGFEFADDMFFIFLLFMLFHFFQFSLSCWVFFLFSCVTFFCFSFVLVFLFPYLFILFFSFSLI